VIAVLGLVTLAGCGAATEDRHQETEDRRSGQSGTWTITSGGQSRSYRLYVPASAPDPASVTRPRTAITHHDRIGAFSVAACNVAVRPRKTRRKLRRAPKLRCGRPAAGAVMGVVPVQVSRNLGHKASCMTIILEVLADTPS
jgi:hypothetical protein